MLAPGAMVMSKRAYAPFVSAATALKVTRSLPMRYIGPADAATIRGWSGWSIMSPPGARTWIDCSPLQAARPATASLQLLYSCSTDSDGLDTTCYNRAGRQIHALYLSP